MYDEDEFSYPQDVQDALNLVERETQAQRRREATVMSQRWEKRQRREDREARRAEQQREADSDAKFWETRRAQQAAQQAKKRFRPAQPDGWVKP
jgi:chlorite dismutase